MSTHPAIFTPAQAAPLEVRQVPTVMPGPGEILLHVRYTASTPLDLHIADGWLLTNAPKPTGGAYAGEVVAVHSSVTTLAPGDIVFGMSFGKPAYAAHQTFATIPAWMCGKLPPNLTMQEAVTVPTNLITIFQAAETDLGLELPWPKPVNFVPARAESPILIWGGSSSVGQYALQVFRHWGYRNLIATASSRHHALVKSLGATQIFDYRNPDVIGQVLSAAGGRVPFIFDCVGHLAGTIEPISKLARANDRVAIVLPVVLKDATENERPEYEMVAEKAGTWAEGVKVSGIRAHAYPQNEFFKENMQPKMVPALLAEGVIKPNAQRIVEGETMLDRAQKALDVLRRKDQSAEKLVWKVSDE